MTRVAELVAYLGKFAPESLAEDWDNVGLLLGDSTTDVRSVMTCLTLTPDVADEAIADQADLIVSHHPIFFRPVQQITNATIEGQMVLKLLRAGIAVHSPHTGYDSAERGVNQQLAQQFQLENIKPLRIVNEDETRGAGRYGDLPQSVRLEELVATAKKVFGLSDIQYVGDPSLEVRRLGIACGAAASFLADARNADCQALLTGESRFHDCLFARHSGLGMILPGHYASERPAIEQLARVLENEFSDLKVWSSRNESDPVRYG